MAAGKGDEEKLRAARALQNMFKDSGSSGSSSKARKGRPAPLKSEYKPFKSTQSPAPLPPRGLPVRPTSGIQSGPPSGTPSVSQRNYRPAGAFAPSWQKSVSSGKSLLGGAGMDFLRREDKAVKQLVSSELSDENEEGHRPQADKYVEPTQIPVTKPSVAETNKVSASPQIPKPVSAPAPASALSLAPESQKIGSRLAHGPGTCQTKTANQPPAAFKYVDQNSPPASESTVDVLASIFAYAPPGLFQKEKKTESSTPEVKTVAPSSPTTQIASSGAAAKESCPSTPIASNISSTQAATYPHRVPDRGVNVAHKVSNLTKDTETKPTGLASPMLTKGTSQARSISPATKKVQDKLKDKVRQLAGAQPPVATCQTTQGERDLGPSWSSWNTPWNDRLSPHIRDEGVDSATTKAKRQGEQEALESGQCLAPMGMATGQLYTVTPVQLANGLLIPGPTEAHLYMQTAVGLVDASLPQAGGPPVGQILFGQPNPTPPQTPANQMFGQPSAPAQQSNPTASTNRRARPLQGLGTSRWARD